MTDGPFRTPSRPPTVPLRPDWGTVRAVGLLCFVAGVSIPGFAMECSGQWRRASECVEEPAPPEPEPPPEPRPFCEVACETIGYRAIRAIRVDYRTSATCVCGNDRDVITLYADGSVGRWSVAP